MVNDAIPGSYDSRPKSDCWMRGYDWILSKSVLLEWQNRSSTHSSRLLLGCPRKLVSGW